MDTTIWARNEQPIPGAYWNAATVGGLLVLFCYATGRWVPGLVGSWAASAIPMPSVLGPLLLLLGSAVLGLATASSVFVALTRPWLGIGLALLTLVFTVLAAGTPLHFGVIAALVPWP